MVESEIKQPSFYFVLYATSQVNSFLKSGVLEELSKKIDVTVVVEDDFVFEVDVSRSLKVLRLKRPTPVLRNASSLVQMVTLWRFRNRSMNHLVRANASFGTKKQRQAWRCVVVSEMSTNLLKRTLIKLLSHNPFYLGLNLIEELISRITFERIAFRCINSNDVVLVPYSGHIGRHFNPWIRGANRRGIKTVALQENWDNLSTKSFITEEPRFFCVWGAQSAGHLRSIHRLFSVEPWKLGSPRFTNYLKENIVYPKVANWDGVSVNLTGSDFVLVAGTGDGIDDSVLIKVVSGVLVGVNNGATKLVYRPHPMTRTKLDYSQLSRDYPGILIDVGPESRNFGHHHALVKDARVVINHLSTLTLEAILAGTRVIIPLFLGRDDAVYRYDHCLNEWHHLMGVSLIRGIYTPESISELREKIKEVIFADAKFDKSNISWICERVDYAEELLTHLEKISKRQGLN